MIVDDHVAPAAQEKYAHALNEKFDRLLARAKPTKREVTLHAFRHLFPRLEAHLSDGRLLKDVLAAFNELSKVKVCARTFNEMLEEERTRRVKEGDVACCRECGHPLRGLNSIKRQPTQGEAIASDDAAVTEGT